MKSKMKSTFAIIAVALMVMVAVVPMVATFISDDTEADHVVVPTASDTITISGKVYDSNGAGVGGKWVIATWGDVYYKVANAVTPSSGTDQGKYTIEIGDIPKDGQLSNVAVFVLTDSLANYGVKDEEYGTVTFDVMSKGTYNADFMCGKKDTKVVTVAFYTGEITSPVSLFKTIYGLTGNDDLYSFEASYTLYGKYDPNADTKYSEEIQHGTVSFLKNNNGKFTDTLTVSVSKDVTTAFICITGIAAMKTIDSEEDSIYIDANGVANIIDNNETVTANQVIAKITTDKDIPVAKITISDVSFKPTSGDSILSDSITMIASSISKTKTVYFMYDKIMDGTTVKAANQISYSVDYGSKITTSEVDTTFTTAGKAVTLVVRNLIYGAFTMSATNPVSAIDGQDLKIRLATKNANDEYVDGNELKVYVANGNYVAQFSADDVTTSKYLKITSVGFKVYSPTMTGDYTSSPLTLAATGNSLPIVLDTTGYTYVTGQLTVYKSGGTESLSKSVSLDIKSDMQTVYAFGAKVSGNTITVQTSTAGVMKLYIQKDSTVKFLPGQNEIFSLDNATGSYKVVGDSFTFNPLIATKTMSFAFADGDGNALATAQDKVHVLFTDGTDLNLTLSEDGVVSVYDGTLDIDYAMVYFVRPTETGQKNTFDAYDEWTAVPYEPNDKGVMNVVANEKTYSLVVKDCNGVVITDALTVTMYVYSTYISATGNTIYDSGTNTAITVNNASSDGQRTFYVSKNYVGKTIDRIAQDIIAFKLAGTNYLFNTIYQFAVDDGSEITMTVKALTDSYSNKLTRSDEKTGISGIIVNLYNATINNNQVVLGDPIGSSVTDEDGAFTISTTVKIDKTKAYVKFTDAYGYEFNAYDKAFVTATKKVDLFKPAKDSYLIVVSDADKSLVDMTGMTLAVSGATKVTISGINYYKAAWKVGDIVSATLEDVNNNTYRTFAKYTITEDDFETGIVGLTTLESTYTIFVKDSEGNGIDAKPTISKTFGGVNPTAVNEGVYIGKVKASPTVDGKYTVVLTAPGVDEAYVAVPRADTAGNATEYKFGTGVYVPFEDNKATIESYYTIVAFTLVDGDGNAVPVPTDDVLRAVVSDSYPGDYRQITVSQSDNIIMFCGDDSAVYKVYGNKENNVWVNDKWTVGNYTFKKSAKIVEGELASAEQLVTFTFVDSLKQPISGIVPTVKYYDATHLTGETLLQNLTTNDAGQISGIVAIDDDYTYGATVANDAFEFAYTDGMAFIADKALVTPTFFTANGKDIEATAANFTKVEAFGINDNTPIATLNYADAKSFYVDMSLVSYYKVTTANGMKYTFDESLLPVFVANETFLTGTVPYSGKGTGSATLELYLEDNMVQEIKGDNVKIVDKYYYEAILDLSGYIGDTAAVVFDSIIVVYYENGVELGYAAVDPYKTVNNIVTPEVEVYVAVLDAPSALIARHVSIAQVGNTATVSADGQFIVADDDAIYTDGQYIYTFAGWYVDNEKVSASPSFTFSLTENVVIVPEYTVKYEKISDANAQVDPEIIIEEITKENTGIDTNVLIIGICAVIVALIAVVYAVIKKE